MKCPVCGTAELIHDTRDLPYTYKGETTVIPAVTADFCPACDESITDMAETDRVMREMRALNKQVNSAIEQAEVIRLSLADQACFAQALLSPPQLSPAIERAIARRGKLLRAE